MIGPCRGLCMYKCLILSITAGCLQAFRTVVGNIVELSFTDLYTVQKQARPVFGSHQHSIAFQLFLHFDVIVFSSSLAHLPHPFLFFSLWLESPQCPDNLPPAQYDMLSHWPLPCW